METPFDIKQMFSPEDRMIVGHLGKFVISFFQALLKIGHFQSDDAKGATAKQALFQEWKHLSLQDREVSFIIQNHEHTSVVLIYGILSEITALENLFSPDMGTLFTPKVCDFFNRRYLSGFTIKPAITIEELDRFIEIMRAPINPVEIDQEIQAIAENMVSQQIIHASVVYTKELFPGKESMHFMAQMVLTRFEKELRTIPLHAQMTKEQKIEQKERVFSDILVPLSNMAIFKEILMHTDAIDSSLWGDPIDVETEIAKGIGRDLLWKFLLEYAVMLHPQSADSSGHSVPETIQEQDHDRLVSIVKKMVLNLSLDKMKDESEEILEVLVKEKTITPLEIPEPVLDRVYLKRKTNDYLQNKERYWEALQGTLPLQNEGQEEGQDDKINGLILILPILLKLNEFLSFGELLEQMRRAWEKGGVREEGAHQEECDSGSLGFLAQVGMESMRGTILSKITDREIPNRKELFVILEPLSLFLCKSLLPLCADENMVLRKNICKVLATTKEKGIADLIAYANEPTRNWYTVRNVVMILGDIGVSDEPVLIFLKHSQRHPNLRVREEVIVSLGKIKGSQAEQLLLRELENPDITSRSRAVLALGNFHPMHKKVQAFIESALKKKRKNESETDEHLQISCCLSLETIARFDPSTAQHFEPILCDILTPDKPNIFGLVREKYHEKGYAVKKEICRLLGDIGTKPAFPLVGRLITENYWRPEDRGFMQQILQKIAHRVGMGEG